MLRYKKGSTKPTNIIFRCSEGFKDEVDRIAKEDEGINSAKYIKGLIIADMKKREEV